MKILVTGGSGMVGKNLLEHKEFSKFETLAPSSRELNLLSFEETEKYLKKNTPDIIIHCAGRVGGIQANIKYPVEFLYENLEMGKNIVMASKDVGIARVINLGSSCMYPRNYENPLKEEYILKGEFEPTNEGYAIAKVATQRLCQYINEEYPDFSYKTLIPCNLYGRWDKFDPGHSHMIPAVVKKIHDAKINGMKSVEIWGDGTAKREFMYASDLADFIYFSISNYEKIPDLINVGLGHDFTIGEYYEAIGKVVGFKGTFEFDLSKPVGMKQKLIDNSKLKDLGWKAKTGLEEGILKTYEFFKQSQGIN